MKLIASQHATFIFTFKDNTLNMELFSIANGDTYLLTMTMDNELPKSYVLKVGDSINAKFLNIKTEKQILHILEKDGFKVK